MGILDNLFKREKKPETGARRKKILVRDNPHEGARHAMRLSMLSHLGKNMNCNHKDQKELKNCYYDPCVNAAANTRLEGLCEMFLVVETENENLKKFIYDQLNPILSETIHNCIWSDFLGYHVGELVWEQEGELLRIRNFYQRDFTNFIPLPDGCSVIVKKKDVYKTSYTDEDIAPYGKYVLCTNNSCPEYPYGEALFQTIYYLVKIREFGYRSWAKWLERFGQPFLIGKIDSTDPKKCEEFMHELDCALDSSSIVTDKDSEIDVLDAKGGSGEHFKTFNECIRKEIQHAILGQNLTSEISNQGSLAAAKVHNEVRNDKIKSDARKVNKVLNDILKMIVSYNGITDEVKVYLKEQDGIEMERAQRDAILVNSGIVSLSEDYLLDRYDFKEGDFILPQPTSPLQNFKSAYRSNKKKHVHKFQNQKNLDELDDVVNILLKSNLSPIDTDELFSAMQAAGNKRELNRQFSAMLADSETPDFENMLTTALYFALHEGVDSHGRR